MWQYVIIIALGITAAVLLVLALIVRKCAYLLKKEVHWLTSILDALPTPLSVTDKDMNWTFINKIVEDMLGIKREEVIGRHCSNWGAHICNTDKCGIALLRKGVGQSYFSQLGREFAVTGHYLYDENGDLAGHVEAVKDITELIDKTKELEAVEKAREAEERWNLINNASPIAVNFWDEHLNFLDGNEMGYKMFGYASKEEWKESWQQSAPEIQPDGMPSIEKFAAAVEKTIADGYYRFEWLHYTKNGEPLPLDITQTRVKHGDSFMIAAFLQDLRPLRDADAKIQEAERESKLRQQRIYDANPIPASLWSEDLKIIDCNSAMVRLLGMSGKGDYTERFYEFVPEFQPDGMRTEDRVAEIIGEASEKGYCRSSFTHLTADKEAVPFDVTVEKIELDGTTLLAVYLQDLRPLLDAAAKLHESEKRAQVLMDACPLAVSMFDERWNEIYCNRTTLEVFGLEDYDLSKPPDFFVHADQPDGAEVSEIYRKVREEVAKNGEYRAELLMQKADGTPLPIDAAYLRLDYGDHYMVAAYYRDLTEERAAQEREREAEERAQTLMDACPLAVAMYDAEWNELTCNQASLDMFGLGPSYDFSMSSEDFVADIQLDGRHKDIVMAEFFEKAGHG